MKRYINLKIIITIIAIGILTYCSIFLSLERMWDSCYVRLQYEERNRLKKFREKYNGLMYLQRYKINKGVVIYQTDNRSLRNFMDVSESDAIIMEDDVVLQIDECNPVKFAFDNDYFFSIDLAMGRRSDFRFDPFFTNNSKFIPWYIDKLTYLAYFPKGAPAQIKKLKIIRSKEKLEFDGNLLTQPKIIEDSEIIQIKKFETKEKFRGEWYSPDKQYKFSIYNFYDLYSELSILDEKLKKLWVKHINIECDRQNLCSLYSDKETILKVKLLDDEHWIIVEKVDYLDRVQVGEKYLKVIVSVK